MIREAMKGKGMVGLGRVVISKRERPIILEPFEKGLRAMTLRYPYEVREAKDYFEDIPDVKISSEMLKLAEHIVDSKAADFDPTEFEDRYEEAVTELLKQKQAGKVITKSAPKAAPQQSGNVIDLLKRSLEIESKRPTKKSPPLQPAMPNAKTKKKARV